MATIRELSEAEYQATLVSPMRKLGVGETPPVRMSLKDYVAAAMEAKNLPATSANIDVHFVYVAHGERHTHVGLFFGVPETYLVVVVDNVAAAVLGFHLLDLGKKFGLR